MFYQYFSTFMKNAFSIISIFFRHKFSQIVKICDFCYCQAGFFEVNKVPKYKQLKKNLKKSFLTELAIKLLSFFIFI